MKTVLFPLAFLTAAVSAQSSACAADYILEACLGTISGQLASCGATDWGCQCTQYQQFVTCFNNCPNDERKHTYEGQEQIFCGYASQFPSSTSTPVSAPASAAPATSATTTGDSTATSGANSANTSPSSTGSAAAASKTNSAADLALNAGGILFAVAGVVAAVL